MSSNNRVHSIAGRLELIENFDKLPDNAFVAPKVAAVVLDVNERTINKHPPVPRIQVSPRRFAFRVADLRALGRNEKVAG